MTKVYIVLTIVVFVLFLFSFPLSSSPSRAIKSTPILTNTPEYGLLADVALWYPSAPWTHPVFVRDFLSYYGYTPGDTISASVISSTASQAHFEDVSALATKGFDPDTNLSSDGPGSSSWGYKKEDGTTMRLLIFSYHVRPTSSNPNQPLQFTCPCKGDLQVFASTSFPTK